MEQHEILLKLRNDASLTLEELAKKTGLSKNMLWHLEKGNRTGTVETLKKLSEFYGVSLDYITNNAKRSDLIDDFIKSLVDEGIISDSENVPEDIMQEILSLIKLKIKKLT
ncbi:helix-turn-helix transcriptional regulator [Clostridium sp. MB40-C1]|uniref:helix-turn-helix domain-containing protein n=1 Tax=Clostridium sp. MB40-C1 TaxID=3070996 RepID=UPI0027DF4F65|nr:helix-turn-helix transcriptional regulator [Clostridium sp. MB40-C1]WMJ79572.1 helix-turn-helix transcriptional regulator [Clostridium sp. MB40-C1]